MTCSFTAQVNAARAHYARLCGLGAHGRPSADRGRPRQGKAVARITAYPENLDHHFVVDPTKFDYYAMDCYRTLGVNAQAETLADEVIQASTDFDGRERAPMRVTEARITLGVIRAARATSKERWTWESGRS